MKGLGKAYPPDQVVLKDIWLSFFPGAKIGVLGVNGSGKSTPAGASWRVRNRVVGEAFLAEGATVGYLPQEPRLDPAKTVLGNVRRGWPRSKRCSSRYDAINAKFGEELSPDELDGLLSEQGRLQDRIDQLHAWDSTRGSSWRWTPSGFRPPRPT